MFRLLGVLVTVLFAIGTAVLTWPQFFRVAQVYPITQLVAARGLLVLGFAVVLVLALLLMLARPLRGFAASIALVALLGGAASAAIMAMRGADAGALPEKTAQSVRVLTWNTSGEAVSSEQIAQTILDQEADIVSLPETTEAAGEQVALILREAGHPMWVHHVQFRPDVEQGPDAWQTTVLISPDLGDYSVIEASADGTSNTGSVPSAVVMPVDGEGPTVVAVHAVAPRQADTADWRDDLRWIADQCPGDDVILAGDFNATLDHMAGMGVDGGDMGACVDIAARTGNGATGTWPTNLPTLLGTPIDHVMATASWTSSGSVVLDGPADGSDHRALVVQLERAD